MPLSVGVIDYGAGNLGSVLRALEELRAVPRVLQQATEAAAADALILPGVGNFSECARRLQRHGWYDGLCEQALTRGKPLLGICLGMQLLATSGSEWSQESQDQEVAGLNLIPGRVEHLARLGCSERVPHVGWNAIEPSVGQPLLADIPPTTDFYFAHSYAFVPDATAHVAATVRHGITFTAAVAHGSVAGTQFHPEKSSRAGFRVLRNFLAQLN